MLAYCWSFKTQTEPCN